MVLFLLAAVPLFYLIMDCLFTDLHGRINESYKPFAFGVICFIVALIIYNIIRLTFITPEFSVSGIYLYYLFHDSLLQYVFAVAGYLLIFGLGDFESSHYAVNRMFAFMCGFYSFWSINDMIISYGWYNSYLLLVLPLQRIGLIAAFCLVFSEALTHDGAVKAMLIVCAMILPFITAAGSLLWRLSYTVPLIVVTAGLPILSIFFLYRKLSSEKPDEKISLISDTE